MKRASVGLLDGAHWNGLGWSAVTMGAPPPLWGVWGSGRCDVWAVGSEILHH